ncbi:putative S-adenosylmethionine-dependent methyltransferase/MSMEI_2290 [bacterium BMS3Abin04]|nr:putative S-adenosylmethionine-dependent methyltransferase/MSMEI_2290 [bacterium BMS3Abin04]
MTEQFNYIAHYKKDAVEFDYFEDRLPGTEHDERRVHEYIISKVPENTKSILDVGSGSAWIAEHFNGNDIKVISLDIAVQNLIKAKQKFPSVNHKQISSDSLKLPFKNESIETVIASEIIEHIVNPSEFVKELFRVVKPGGSLIITTPYKEIIRYCLCIHCNKKTSLHGHLHSFDEHKLLNLYNDKSIANVNWFVFGNKALIFLRTHTILKYFPFLLWKYFDKLMNLILNKPAHILMKYEKTGKNE